MLITRDFSYLTSECGERISHLLLITLSHLPHAPNETLTYMIPYILKWVSKTYFSSKIFFNSTSYVR